MDIKFSHIWNALAKLRDDIGADATKDLKMETSIVEDNPGSGKMIECLTLKCTMSRPASTYDSFKSSTDVEYTLEVFADSENRVPRMTVVASRDLEKKDS